MRLERRSHVPLALALGAPIGAIVAALALEAYQRILIGALGSRLSITETLTRTTPLILTGLAAAVAFRARLWNIGAEGQFYVGALAATALGSKFGLHMSTIASIPSLMLVG